MSLHLQTCRLLERTNIVRPADDLGQGALRADTDSSPDRTHYIQQHLKLYFVIFPRLPSFQRPQNNLARSPLQLE
jgi:hypothetical protein